VATNWFERTAIGVIVTAALVSGGCGDYVRQGRSPVQVVIQSLQAASGAQPGEVGNDLRSDVITLVESTINGATVRIPTVFNDVGSVTMALILKNPGTPLLAASPSEINQVTFGRYRVTYRRADGRNTPGVDVPFPFDSAVTFSVPMPGSASFQIVRHTAKEEAPLAALGANNAIISTIAEVSFFGRDQAGNDVTATGSIGIDFGNFGDPE
jgi:hypothetical protein